MRKMRISQRPENFIFKHDHPLTRGLVFAGLGQVVKTNIYYNSSLLYKHASLINMEPGLDWNFIPELGRFSLLFDGSNEAVRVLNSYAVFNQNNDCSVTISAWFKPKQLTTNLPIASFCPEDVYYLRKMSLEVGGADENDPLKMVHTGSAGTAYASTGSLTTDRFYHGIGFIRHIGGYSVNQCVLNGVYGTEGASTNTSQTTDGRRIVLGAEDQVGVLTRYHNIEISDVLMWTRKLNNVEVQLLADPSNIMLSGMLEPPKRQLYNISYHPLTESALFTRICFVKKSSSSAAGIKAIRRTR